MAEARRAAAHGPAAAEGRRVDVARLRHRAALPRHLELRRNPRLQLLACVRDHRRAPRRRDRIERADSGGAREGGGQTAAAHARERVIRWQAHSRWTIAA